MTKVEFVVRMQMIKECFLRRQVFLDRVYEFCSDRFANYLFDEFDMFDECLCLIEDEVCRAVGLNKDDLSTDWLNYFVFDCECSFPDMKVSICQEPFPIESWSDVWDFYVELAR